MVVLGHSARGQRNHSPLYLRQDPSLSDFTISHAVASAGGFSAQIDLIGAARLMVIAKPSAAPNGGLRGNLPTHPRGLRSGRPVMPNASRADRIFLQRRPLGECPHLPLTPSRIQITVVTAVASVTFPTEATCESVSAETRSILICMCDVSFGRCRAHGSNRPKADSWSGLPGVIIPGR
jgi:hypothetical protein